MKKKVSIMIPCYNEEENIEAITSAVRDQMEQLPQYDWEIVVIDNCSKDNTRPLLREICAKDKRIKAIFNVKNFGQFNSPYYGLTQCTGDCAISVCADFQDPAIIRLATSEIPTVTLDYSFDSRTSILSDNVRGMEALVRFVYEKGHRRIAFIHGEMTTVTQKRLASFKKTCALLGISVPADYIRPAYYHDPRSSGLATRELLALSERPTCIFYPDDLSFLGGMTELEKHGISVPDGMSVVGYDGIPLSQVLRPRLTTYRQGAEAMGREAARSLIEEIEHRDTWLPQQILVEGELLEGSTVREID